MSNEAPVVDAPSSQEEVKAAPAAKASPAQELRDIQALLVSGVFQGNMAPALCKAYQLLEQMAVTIEKNETQKPS